MKVIERMHDDNQVPYDLIHEWYSVKEALKSGRFDYLIEWGWHTKKELNSCTSVEQLVEGVVGYPFYCCK